MSPPNLRQSEILPDGILSCTRMGRIDFASPGLLAIVAHYFRIKDKTIESLPGVLRRAITKKATGWMEITVDEGTLRASWLPGKNSGHYVILHQVRPVSREEKFRAHGLSPRECEVARWLIEGRTNDEIAELLSISRNTSRTHVERILAKLEVKTPTGVAAKLIGGP